ncbi:MAG TPA: hypothetical protein VJQ45_10335 [Ktedonobacterales bacterium]|nr:hypothetical protein [Ktedonobacterales bacterium]
MAVKNVETKVQEAVETWTETTREAYQAITNSVIAAQERGAQLAQTAFETGLAEMKSQAETSRAVLETLAEQSEKQWQATRTLAQESLGAYSEFVSAPFAFYQKWVESAQQAAKH